MSDANNNNQGNDFNQDNTGSVNTAGQSAGYNNGQYYNNQQTADNGQYYGQNTGYNNGQYYDPNTGYNNGQYYNANDGYNNGQYYNQNGGYNYGQYYDQNGSYYQQGYNNGQYGGQQDYGNGQYNGYDQQQGYNNGQYAGYGQQQGYHNGQYNNYGQYNYGQYGGQPYPYNSAAFSQAEPVNEPVTNVFYYILMALTAVSVIASLINARSLITTMFSYTDFDTVAGQDMTSLYSSIMSIYSSGGYTLYSVLNSALGFAILAFSIADIIACHKKGYPIIGLILFTILFKPGYFLWRAHVVKQKKTIPVLFTVGYVVFYFAYFIWTFSYMMSLVV